jgi:hypothetical protein
MSESVEERGEAQGDSSGAESVGRGAPLAGRAEDEAERACAESKYSKLSAWGVEWGWISNLNRKGRGEGSAGASE